MSFSRFSWPLAVFLSFCTLSDAWVLHRKADSKKVDGESIPQIELRREAQNAPAEKR
jgi:hypothetical protein